MSHKLESKVTNVGKMRLIKRRIRVTSYRDMHRSMGKCTLVVVADGLVDYHIVLNGSLEPGDFNQPGQQSQG